LATRPGSKPGRATRLIALWSTSGGLGGSHTHYPSLSSRATSSGNCSTINNAGVTRLPGLLTLGRRWAIGGPFTAEDGNPVGWGRVDDNESIRAIGRVLDLGITFFDTADVYGGGSCCTHVGPAVWRMSCG